MTFSDTALKAFVFDSDDRRTELGLQRRFWRPRTSTGRGHMPCHENKTSRHYSDIRHLMAGTVRTTAGVCRWCWNRIVTRTR